ncbi:MAG TPA: HDOD domain-containing protein [Deltaproteobacteria bacterium]|nr:HDOD domain-containing protein [Deltaproteobacteria bacterium]
MDIYIARQPIFTRSKEIHAYELLFRGGMDNCFPDIDGDTATSRVISNAFLTSGVEQVTGGKAAYINFPKHLLVKKIPLFLPPQITTVEILEDVVPDEELLACCREFLARGYTIALDDFEDSPSVKPLIDLAHILKIDFMKTSRDQITEYAQRFLSRGKKLLAEKVETDRDFQTALHLGFSYFQGYFFSKPQVIRDTEIPSLKMNLLRIMGEARREDYDVDKLEKFIEKDVGISYKLLRYLNSPFFRRRNEITSIRQAIVMLGEKGIRSFLSVIILSELSQDKPDELIKSSVIRARMCEQLSRARRGAPDPSELFTLGLFSHIDAILDNTMENIMKRLPLADEIKKTLTGIGTPLREYLDLVTNYQSGSWETAETMAGRLQIPPDMLPSLYLDALGFADALYSATE